MNEHIATKRKSLREILSYKPLDYKKLQDDIW